VLWLFFAWENRRLERQVEPLISPSILLNRTLRGGLIAFFFQHLLQAGLFFAVPPFLSVSLGLSAIATGVRLHRSARLPTWERHRVVGAGRAERRGGRPPEHGHQPWRVDRHSVERRGAQRRPHEIPRRRDSEQPESAVRHQSRARSELSSDVPFLSDADLKVALQKAGVPRNTADAILDDNATARLDALRSSLSVIAVIALIALFSSLSVPKEQPVGASSEGTEVDLAGRRPREARIRQRPARPEPSDAREPSTPSSPSPCRRFWLLAAPLQNDHP
jgi:hypothetical protein